MPAFAGMTPRLPLDAREIRDGARRVADLVEQLEAVLAQFLLVGAVGDVDGDLVEEGIDVRAKLGHGAHAGLEVLARDRGGSVFLRYVDRTRQRLFLLLAVKRGIGPPDIFAPVLLLLDADDVGRALV